MAHTQTKSNGRIKHGMSHSRVYKCWSDMKIRCNNPNKQIYKYYGGRGITYCEEWERFEPFYEWAINNGYSDNLTLDRIDVNKNYCPQNCRWVTKSVQNANKRNTGKCEYIGVCKHSNGTLYNTFIKKDGELIFFFGSPSKNECARKRNQYILEHNLQYPLNEIKEEYEEVCKHKYESKCVAISKIDNSVVKTSSISEMSRRINLSKQFIRDCVKGKRNSKKYIFSYERRLAQ